MIKDQRNFYKSLQKGIGPDRNILRIENLYKNVLVSSQTNKNRMIRKPHQVYPKSNKSQKSRSIPKLEQRISPQAKNQKQGMFSQIHHEYYDDKIPCTIHKKSQRKKPHKSIRRTQRNFKLQSITQKTLEKKTETHRKSPFIPESTISANIFNKSEKSITQHHPSQTSDLPDNSHDTEPPKNQYQISCNAHMNSGSSVFQQNRFMKSHLEKENIVRNVSHRKKQSFLERADEIYQKSVSPSNSNVLRLQEYQIRVPSKKNTPKNSILLSQLHKNIFEDAHISKTPKLRNSSIQISKLNNPIRNSNRISLLLQSINRHQGKPFQFSSTNRNSKLSPSYKFKKTFNQQNYGYKHDQSMIIINDVSDLIERIETHICILDLFGEYTDKIKKFHEGEESQEEKLLRIGLLKKGLIERKRIIEVLKRDSNLINPFCLTEVSIPLEYLKQYSEYNQIQEILQQTKTQLTALQTKYQQLLITPLPDILQNPYDCSLQLQKYLVEQLYSQLISIQQCLQSSKISEDGYVMMQDLTIETVQIMYIISQLGGKKIRKVTFPDEVLNFEQYYEQSVNIVEDIVSYFKIKNQ